jgi:hypothetical protein
MDPFFGPVIVAYTRADALRDGVLVDVTETAREMGYRVPVAVTRAVWVGVVEPDETPGQSVEGRLWDVLWMLHYAIKTRPRAGSLVRYQLYATIGGFSRLVTLKAVIGPGDEGEPVITIMEPDED